MNKTEYKVGDTAYFYDLRSFEVKLCTCIDVVSYHGRSASDDDIIDYRFSGRVGCAGPFTLTEIKKELRIVTKELIKKSKAIQKFLNDPKNKP